jgi:hypothetical protein
MTHGVPMGIPMELYTGLGGKSPWSKQFGISPRLEDSLDYNQAWSSTLLSLDSPWPPSWFPGSEREWNKVMAPQHCPKHTPRVGQFWGARDFEIHHFICPKYKKCMVLQMDFLVLKRSFSDCHMWFPRESPRMSQHVTTAYPGYFPSPLPKKWDDGRPTAELLLESDGTWSKGTVTGPPFMVFSPVNYSTSCLIKLWFYD